MASAPSARGDEGAGALAALAQREARIASRIAHLESVIADESLGVVKRTKARVELALLKSGDDDAHRSRLEDLAGVRGTVSKNRQKVERGVKSNREWLAHERAIREHQADLHQQALQRRMAARKRVEEARRRAAEAEAALVRAEMEAAAGEDSAAAREKIEQARRRVEEERRLLHEAMMAEEREESAEQERRKSADEAEEAKGEDGDVAEVEEGSDQRIKPYSYASKKAFAVKSDSDSMSDEGEDVAEKEMDAAKADIANNENEPGDAKELEGLETVETESKTESSSDTDDAAVEDAPKGGEDGGDELAGEGIKDAEEKGEEEMAISDDEFHDAQVEEDDAAGEMEKDELYYAHVASLEETIRELRAIIQRQAEKIESLESHIAQTSEARAFWEEQSAKLSFELHDMHQLKEVQETELRLLKERVESDDDKIGTLLSEVDDLKGMQKVLEWKLSTAKAEERESLQSLKDEIDKLLGEREKALEEAQALRGMYERSIEQHEAAIADLKRDAGVRIEELEHARALLQESEGQLQSMRERDAEFAGDRRVRMEALAEELKGERERASELERAAELQTFAMASMKKRLAQKDSEIERLSSTIEEETAAKANREEEKENVAELTSELDMHRELVAEYRQTTEELKKELAQKDSAMQLLSDMLAEETQKNEKQAEEDLELNGFVVANLKRKLSEKDSEIEKMEALLESAAENGDEIQAFVIASQKKKLSLMNSEMQTLSSQLAAEKAKGQSKVEEAAHYKEYAITLEQRRNELEMAHIATQRKLSKRVFNLQKEVSELEKKAASGKREGQQRRTLSRMDTSDDGSTLPGSVLFDTGASVGSASDHYTVYTDASWEAKAEKNTLEQLLCRVLAERDKLAVENEELRLANERMGSSPPEGTTVGAYLSLAREREIAALEKKLVDLTAEKKTLESWRLMADACETNDDTSKEECLVMLQSIQEEQAELEAKLKLLLEDKNPTDDDGKEVSFGELPPRLDKKAKPPKQSQVYQLTCRECNDDLNYIGKTRRELKRQMKYHFDDVWRIVRKDHFDGLKESAPVVPPDDGEPASDFALSPFAKHFTRHCRNASSYEECLRWCTTNIKVQRQKVQNDWEDLEEDGMVRTVYQLSCRCCENHHYIGSTLDTLRKKVIKHYSDIWDLVQKEYGDGGFREDTENYGVKMGKFGTSASHFAKHCRHAKSIKDIDRWCEKNIKVEKWIMVCRKCLGTAVDTNLNLKNQSIMSFKVEHSLDLEKKGDKGEEDRSIQSPGSHMT